MEVNPAVNYRVWGADKIAYGPVELPELVNWIKQGRVASNAWVFKDDTGWARASDLTELKVLFKSKLPANAAAAADAIGCNRGRCGGSKCSLRWMSDCWPPSCRTWRW